MIGSTTLELSEKAMGSVADQAAVDASEELTGRKYEKVMSSKKGALQRETLGKTQQFSVMEKLKTLIHKE